MSTSSRTRGWALTSGLLTTVIGLAGLAVGLAAVCGVSLETGSYGFLPFGTLDLELDALGGLFEILTGGVAAVVGLYTIGYGNRGSLPRFSLTALPLFVASVLLVPWANSASSFLCAWELMALSSLVLILTEHHRKDVRTAAVFYAVLTQFGFALILVALVALSAAADADGFSTWGEADIPPGLRSTVFLLTLLGFGSKAGLLPFHAWLPRAHPEAPSPVSALLSAAMVNMGVYGIIRIDLDLLGPGPRWWGLVLMALGGLSAVYGVLQASTARDLKRLLAYSTTENMGLIVLALGSGVLLDASGHPNVAAIAVSAAVIHLIAHAAFKTLGFLAAGSVLVATGTRDLDRLGGLARRMPRTTILFGVSALGAAGLPLGAGFVSEWLLIQSLIHTPQGESTVLSLAMPLAVGTVALTTGLGILTMVKAFGVGFLARPRSKEAENARESPSPMLWGMYFAAVACLAVALVPAVVGPVLSRVLADLPVTGDGEPVSVGMILRLPGELGSISPTLLAGALVVSLGLAALLSRQGTGHRPPSAVKPLWACGGGDPSPRMEYTATSFAEPLQRVFDDVLKPDTDVQITHVSESRYLIEQVTYRNRQSDSLERSMAAPVVSSLLWVAERVRRVHTGSIHVYLLYGALGLLVAIGASL